MPSSLSPRLVRSFGVLSSLALLATSLSCSQVQPPSPDTIVNEVAALPSDEVLKQRLDESLDYTLNERRLNTRDHFAWQIVHGIMAYGPNYPIEHEGKDVKALTYLVEGGKMKGWEFEPGEKLDSGRQGLRAQLQIGSKQGQGHPDQWLGYFSMCNIPITQTIQVDDHTYTLKDYLEQAMRDTARIPNGEYSWTVMALTEYYPTDLKWKSGDKEFTIEQLMQHEAEQDIPNSACGGTHRLTALAVARNRHLAKGGQLTGGWKAADDTIQKYLGEAKKFQNPNGTFSSNYVARAGSVADASETLNTSGHVFEFVVTAATDEQLREPWIKRAAVSMCDFVRKTKDLPVEIGGIYHGAHGMVVYRERLFGKRPYPAESTKATEKVAGQ